MSLEDVQARVDEIYATMQRKKMKIRHVNDKLNEVESFHVHLLLYEGSNSVSDLEFQALMRNKIRWWEKYKKKVAKFRTLEKEYRAESKKYQRLLLEAKETGDASSDSTVQQTMKESSIIMGASIVKEEGKEAGIETADMKKEIFEKEKVKYVRNKLTEVLSKQGYMIEATEVTESGDKKYTFEVERMMKVEYKEERMQLFFRTKETDKFVSFFCIDERSTSSAEFTQSFLVKTFVECLKNTYIQYHKTSTNGALRQT